MKAQAAPPAHYGWLTERSGYTPGAGFRALEVVDAGGRVRAMAGFDGWTPAAVWLHVVVESPAAARPLLHAAFDYAFHQCSRHLVLGLVRASHTRLLRMADRVGFKVVHRLPGAWEAGEDMVVLQLRRESCRWVSTDARRAA